MTNRASSSDEQSPIEQSLNRPDPPTLATQLAIEAHQKGYTPANVARILAGSPNTWPSFLRITREIADTLKSAGITLLPYDEPAKLEGERQPLNQIVGKYVLEAATQGMSMADIAAALFSCKLSVVELILRDGSLPQDAETDVDSAIDPAPDSTDQKPLGERQAWYERTRLTDLLPLLDQKEQPRLSGRKPAAPRKSRTEPASGKKRKPQKKPTPMQTEHKVDQPPRTASELDPKKVNQILMLQVLSTADIAVLANVPESVVNEVLRTQHPK